MPEDLRPDEAARALTARAALPGSTLTGAAGSALARAALA